MKREEALNLTRRTRKGQVGRKGLKRRKSLFFDAAPVALNCYKKNEHTKEPGARNAKGLAADHVGKET